MSPKTAFLQAFSSQSEQNNITDQNSAYLQNNLPQQNQTFCLADYANKLSLSSVIQNNCKEKKESEATFL